MTLPTIRRWLATTPLIAALGAGFVDGFDFAAVGLSSAG
jgi:hypothetical protein